MMRCVDVLTCLTVALAAWPAPGRAVDIPVDLELVLAVDVSGSMDISEQELQRQGYMEALVHPDVLGAIASGIHARIAVAYVEWAGVTEPELVVPWTLIEGDASARRFVDVLAEAPLARIRGTSISQALLFSTPLFDANGFEGWRKVIDVSGDGPNNMGPPVEPAREAALDRGIIINGLPIMLNPSRGFASISNLDIYYEDCVVGGPGSFVLPVRERDQFATAVRQKLLLEIAGAAPRLVPTGGGARRPARVDCMVGEAQRRLWDWEYGR